MRQGAVILCGGKSSRMGREKAGLPFGPEVMLQRVVRMVGDAVSLENVVVVAGPKQVLPELPAEVVVARDDEEFLGPLAGMTVGLRAIADRVDAVYVTGCDVPLLVPAFVVRMFELLGNNSIAVPVDEEHEHPLAAVYRPAVGAQAGQLLRSGRLRPAYLFDEVETRRVRVDELRDVDPQLLTLKNVNRLEEYEAALAVAGFELRGA